MNARHSPQSMDAVLGTVKDADVAVMFGVSVSTVYQRRKTLGIPSHQEQIRVAFIEQNQHRLATEDLSALAREHGLSVAALRNWVKAGGIRRERAVAPRRNVERDREIATLVMKTKTTRSGHEVPVHSMSDVADMFGLTRQRVHQICERLGVKPKCTDDLEDYIAERLGTMPDKAIGDLVGMDYHTICSRRIELGIEPFGRPAGVQRLLDANEALVGRYPDSEVARRIGTSVQRVREYRMCLGRKSVKSDNVGKSRGPTTLSTGTTRSRAWFAWALRNLELPNRGPLTWDEVALHGGFSCGAGAIMSAKLYIRGAE